MPSIATATGPRDERHRQLRDWLRAELTARQLQPHEEWFCRLTDAAGAETAIPVSALLTRIDAGENLIDHYEMFVEPFSRERAL